MKNIQKMPVAVPFGNSSGYMVCKVTDAQGSLFHYTKQFSKTNKWE